MHFLIAYSALVSCALAHPPTFIDTLDSYWQQWTSDGSSSGSARGQEQPLLVQLLLEQTQQLLANQQSKQSQQLRPDGDVHRLYGYDSQLLQPSDGSKLRPDENAATAKLLSKLRPEKSTLDVSAGGKLRGLGVYFEVLPDEEYGDEPIYNVGGSVSGGEEPTRLNYGFLPSLFG